MSKHWIINDAYFGQIRDVGDGFMKTETIYQFIDYIRKKSLNPNILTRNLSDIYVLVASLGAQSFLRKDEKTWKDIMNKRQYAMLEKNGHFIVSYMLVSKKDQRNHYIERFDTFVRNHNLGYVMIEKYEKEYEVNLVPQEIIQSSAEYWAKILGLLWADSSTGEKFIDCKYIEEYIKNYKLDENDLCWEHLYALCNIYPKG